MMLSPYTSTLEFKILPGQYFDSETNLHYNYFRDYDPATGRYITSDPIGLRGGLNSYFYAGANPIRFYDTDALDYQEHKEGIKAIGPYDAYNAGYDIAGDAKNSASSSGLPGPHNGPQDAYRHCVWSCLMTRALGSDAARAIGGIHEAANQRSGQPNDEKIMDDANNAAGRICGEQNSQKTCEELCMDRYKRCSLTGYGGVPICY